MYLYTYIINYLYAVLVFNRKKCGGKFRRPHYRAAAHIPNFTTLVPAPELSLSDAKNNPFRKMCDTLYRERQLWSGNEDGEIRYVSGSSVAGTSALLPGVPRHFSPLDGIFQKNMALLIYP